MDITGYGNIVHGLITVKMVKIGRAPEVDAFPTQSQENETQGRYDSIITS